ncbi:hypothetical protein MTR_5g078850 [Medicago truncatula]|uniref:Uncharacterized protein n=1 Tax=Medicago truncatula TaxID=3880 RepID=G7K1U8_MEDTR|nr:hypothetical protein MTR_5g078850 [Medicago truncatula]
MGIASGRVSDFNGLVFDIRDRPFILTQNRDCSPDNPPTRSNPTVYPFFNSVFRVTVGFWILVQPYRTCYDPSHMTSCTNNQN